MLMSCKKHQAGETEEFGASIRSNLIPRVQTEFSDIAAKITHWLLPKRPLLLDQ